MQRRITITESDYDAILQWETDGAGAIDVEYIVIPNRIANRKLVMTKKLVEKIQEPDSDEPTLVTDVKVA
jgi:hypothetical protein